MKNMLFLFITSFLLKPAVAQNRYKIIVDEYKNKREKLGNCTFKYPHQFQEGERFIFAKDAEAVKGNWELFNFYKTTDILKPRGKRERLYRKKYDGKIVKLIHKIDTSFAYLDHETYMTFEVEETGEHISHRLAFSSNAQEEALQYNPEKNQIVCLPYLIYLPEVDSFKAKFMGKTLFAKFTIGDKKYEKINIVNVGAGTDKAPIRVVYQTESGQKGFTDICTCGSNIPQTIIDQIYFENVFLQTNPKENFQGNDKTWESVQHGELEKGMSEEELVLAWGQPQKIIARQNGKEYLYPSASVDIENGKIKDFGGEKE